MPAVGRWPTSASSGAFTLYAVTSAADAFNKPGPGTMQNACCRPVAIAAPKAM